MVYTINGEQLTRRKLITIDGSQVTTQTGIPLMLNIDLPNVATDGKDVRLAKLDGTPIAREIECVDVPNTDSVTIHYPFDTVASTDSQFYVYWGNASLSEPAADSTYGSEAVWDSNHAGVWHMNNDPNGDVANSIKDSTSNTNHGTPSGSMTTADLVDGNYGKAIDFDGSNDFINFGTDSSLSPALVTVLVRFKTTSSAGRALVYRTRGPGLGTGYTIDANGIASANANKGSFEIYDGTWRYVKGTTVINDNSEHTISGLYNGTNIKIYTDGGDEVSASGATLNYNGAKPLYAARTDGATPSYLPCVITEIRIINIAQTANYITTTHKNLGNPTASGTGPFYKLISTPQHQRRTPQFIN